MAASVVYGVNYLKYRFLRPLVESSPWLYIHIQKVRFRKVNFHNKLVDRHTDLTIEGFPRSANTFSVRAFQQAQQDRKYKIGNHTHSYAQVIRSVNLGVPTALLIRDPRSALASLGALKLVNMGGDITRFIREQSMTWQVEYYIRFYSKLLKYADKIVVIPFSYIIEDASILTRMINARYKVNFDHFQHSDKCKKQIFENHGQHLSPSTKRDQLKSEIETLIDAPKFEEQMCKAEKVYEQWLEIFRSQKELLSKR